MAGREKNKLGVVRGRWASLAGASVLPGVVLVPVVLGFLPSGLIRGGAQKSRGGALSVPAGLILFSFASSFRLLSAGDGCKANQADYNKCYHSG